MEAHNDKKWFVYVGDHHEGPFSVAELQQKMPTGQVSSSSFVWAEGMSDWKAITEVESLRSLLQPPRAGRPAENAMPAMPTLESAPEVQFDARDLAPQRAAPVVPTQPEAPIRLESNPANQREPQDPLERAVHSSGNTSFGHLDIDAPKRPRAPVKLIGFFVVVAAGAVVYSQGLLDPLFSSPGIRASGQAVRDATQPFMLKLADQMPALGKWISPIPALDDVTPAEYQSLQTAARSKLGETGPVLAVALAQGDLVAPVFRVASNLPDGARIDVYAEGIPDTLLNQLSFNGKVSAVIQKKLGATEPLKFTGGQPLPRGQYNIYAVEAEEQPPAIKSIFNKLQPANAKVPAWMPKGLKVVATSTYFLGGVKDTTYLARLKEFHDRLREKANNELNDIRQFAATLDNQLQATRSGFDEYSKLKVKAQRQRFWAALDQKWTALESKVNESFAKWTPESLSKDYFYGSLYELVRQAGLSVEKLHQLHTNYFNGATLDAKAFEIQHGQAMAEAQTNLATLRAKIEQATKIEPTPNGMPRKEGL